MAQWQRARLITSRTQDRSLLPVFSISAGLSEHANRCLYSNNHRDGAEDARGAHNPEVTGSSPVSGIYHLSALQKPMVTARATLNTSTLFTGMAQRQRARLITLRTQDRSLLPVFSISAGLSEHANRCLYSKHSPGWRSGSARGS